MALEKLTYVDQIEINYNGDVAVRLVFSIMEDGKELTRKFHRTFIGRGVPPSIQMDEVAKHLAEMGEAPVGQEDLARLFAICNSALAATPSGGRGQHGR